MGRGACFGHLLSLHRETTGERVVCRIGVGAAEVGVGKEALVESGLDQQTSGKDFQANDDDGGGGDGERYGPAWAPGEDRDQERLL